MAHMQLLGVGGGLYPSFASVVGYPFLFQVALKDRRDSCI